MHTAIENTAEVSPRGKLYGFVTKRTGPIEPEPALNQPAPFVWPPSADYAVMAIEPAAEAPKPGAGVVRRASRGWRVKNWCRGFLAGEQFIPAIVKAVHLARRCKDVPLVGKMIAGSLGAMPCVVGEVHGFVTHADGSVTDYGVLGRHLVVTAGKNFLAACFPNTNEPENMKYHGYGTGNTAAAAGDTALQTEETTQYATDNTRPTGSQSSSTNTYTTAATYSPDSGGTRAITEWGLLSQAATGGGTLFDRQVFSAVNLVASADSLTTTYTLTIS